MSTRPPPTAEEFAKRAFEDSYRHLAGPMPMQEFLDTFLPRKVTVVHGELTHHSKPTSVALHGRLEQVEPDPFVSRVSVFSITIAADPSLSVYEDRNVETEDITSRQHKLVTGHQLLGGWPQA